MDWTCKTWTGLVKHGLVKHGLVKHGLVKHGLVQHGLVKHGLVKHGLVKHGLVKHGLVKHGLDLRANLLSSDMFLYMYSYKVKQVKIHELFCCPPLPLPPPYFAPGIVQTITK
jgi:hypothetical protein